MNDKTISLITSWANQLQHALLGVAPKVWGIAVQVKRVDSIGELITAAIGISVFVVVAIKLWNNCLTYWRRGNGEKTPGYEFQYYGDGAGIVSIFSGIGAVISGGLALGCFVFDLLNQWLWVGVFYPQLAVAHDIISKITGQ